MATARRCGVSKHVGQIRAWIDAVEFAAPDERIHCGCTLAPAVGASEHKIFSSERDAAQGIFGEYVADLDSAVFAVKRKRVP